MRPKFVFALLLAIVLALGAALLLKRHPGGSSSAPANPPSEAAVSQVGTSVVTEVAPPPQPAPAPLSTAPATPNALTSEQRQEAIDAEVDRLYQWSMNDDAASLSNILAGLTNSEKEIREAAIESVKQFGSTDAIPALKAAAEATDNLQEKIAYLEAADFLTVPQAEFTRSTGTTTPKTPEQIQADELKKAQRDARHNSRLPQPGTQSSPSPDSP
jgi:hypothetical protein